MPTENEFIVDGNEVNRLLDAYQLEAYQETSQLHEMLPGQVFEIIEKKFIKSLADQISRSGASTVRFVNLEAIALGSHRDFLYAICGGLAELVDSLEGRAPVPPWPNFVKFERKIEITGIIQNPWVLPWELVSKIDKTFKGLPTPGSTKG
jgi:hypothetical protein